MSVLESDLYKRALAFVKKKHGAIRHANNVPAWHHLARVSERLDYLLAACGEGSDQDREVVVISSLGHDLLEDTDASPEEIRSLFGERGARLISESTNTWGDENVSPYVEKMRRASEETRLIKLADLSDNETAVAYNAAVLGRDWIASYFLPTVKPMEEAMLAAAFPTYSKTAAALKEDVRLAGVLLAGELERL